MAARSNKITMHLFPHQSKAHLRHHPSLYSYFIHCMQIIPQSALFCMNEWLGYLLMAYNLLGKKSLMSFLYVVYCDLYVHLQLNSNKNRYDCFEVRLINSPTQVTDAVLHA